MKIIKYLFIIIVIFCLFSQSSEAFADIKSYKDCGEAIHKIQKGKGTMKEEDVIKVLGEPKYTRQLKSDFINEMKSLPASKNYETLNKIKIKYSGLIDLIDSISWSTHYDFSKLDADDTVAYFDMGNLHESHAIAFGAALVLFDKNGVVKECWDKRSYGGLQLEKK